MIHRFPDNSRVVFLGDSITDGGKWHAHVFDYYAANFPESKIKMFNCGISGGSAGSGLKYLEDDVMIFSPTHVVIMVGINDVGRDNYTASPSDEQLERQRNAIKYYRANMYRLCRELTERKIKVILCTPSPFDVYTDRENNPYPNAQYGMAICADIVRGLASLYSDVPAVEFFGIMSRMCVEKTLTGDDRVHPTQLGHAVMGRIFLRSQGFNDIEIVREELPLSQRNACRKATEGKYRTIWDVEWLILQKYYGKSDKEKIAVITDYVENKKYPNDYFKHIANEYLKNKPYQSQILTTLLNQTDMMYENDIIRGILPDALTFNNGTPVKDASGWKRRRDEIIKSAVELEFGGMPPEPEFFEIEPIHIPGAGALNSYRIFTGTRACPFSFVLQLYRPDASYKKCPVILTGDGCYKYCGEAVTAEALSRGFIVAKFNRTEFAPDIYNTDRISGIYKTYPNTHFSAVSAWAWGYSRAVDALLTMRFVDPEQIAITGHSRGGKTVMLAGAYDERIAYTNPNNSGAHGCGCYRYEQYEPESEGDKRNEKLEDLVRAVPYWMGPDMKTYIDREDELPHDMHFFKALAAPRYFLETEGKGDIWGNPKGSYQTFLAAKEVYKFLGCEDNIAAWYREGGHNHGFADFKALMDFMDCKIGNKPLPQAYKTNPYPEMRLLEIKKQR